VGKKRRIALLPISALRKMWLGISRLFERGGKGEICKYSFSQFGAKGKGKRGGENYSLLLESPQKKRRRRVIASLGGGERGVISLLPEKRKKGGGEREKEREDIIGRGGGGRLRHE